MKKIILHITLFISAMQIIPAHAMLVNVARSALRPALLRTGANVMPATLSKSDALFSQPNNRSLARALATQQHENVETESESEENAHDSGNNYYGWGNFRKATPALGVSLFGVHLWWSEDDICQTPEDFEDSEKLARTKECLTNGNKGLVFDIFIENFDTLKKSPEALQSVLEFFNATFDVFRHHYDRHKALKRLILINFDVYQANTFGTQLIQKMSLSDPYFSEALATGKLIAQSKSQIGYHFRAFKQKNVKKLYRFMLWNKSNKQCRNIIKQIIKFEEKELAKGNYTFVHASNWPLHCLQDVDAELRSIAYKTPKQPLSLRFTSTPNITTGEKYKALREKFIENGASPNYRDSGKEQKHMIFLNYSFFTNTYWSYSATFSFFVQAHSENQPSLSFEDIFKHLGLEKYYDIYEKDLNDLFQLHNKASSFGAGILFSFTPEMLKKSVFVCYPYGTKRMVEIDGIGETNDVKVILDTLKSAPEKIHDLDRLEFAFVVTKDCALNPRVQEAEGYKAIPFNAADPEKYALYEQKRDELITKIKADIDAERAAQSEAERTAHEKKLQAIAAWFATHNCLTCNESRTEEA